MHRLVCEKAAGHETIDDAELDQLLQSMYDEVPDPQSYLSMAELAELEEMELDRAPLVADRIALPPELQEMLDEDEAISDEVAGFGNQVKCMQKEVKASHRRDVAAKAAGKGKKRKETDVTPEGHRRELDDSNSNPMQKKPRTRRANRGDEDINDSKPAESSAEASAPAPGIESVVEASAPAPGIDEAVVEASAP
ncbi:unnamed protein product, partial [Symbiodinium microadriaticum]